MVMKGEHSAMAITEDIAALASLTEAAEKAAEQNQGPATLHNALSAFTKAVDALRVDYTEGEGEEAKTHRVFTEDMLTVIGAEASNLINGFVAQSASVTEALAALTGADRAEGDRLARGLHMAAHEMHWAADTETEQIDSLVTRWNATAPKSSGRTRSKGTGEGSASDMPFVTKITCDKCRGTDHPFDAEETTLRNSLRWAGLKHLEKVHNTVSRKTSNPLPWQGLTEAIDTVNDTEARAAQGGGFTVDRGAPNVKYNAPTEAPTEAV